jgi:putative N6-adenine-specific DNA methylase
MVDNALKNRIKRHVIGPTQSFFAVTAPGLENLCYQELSAMPGNISHAEIISGGVAFKGRLPDMYRANLDLRTPTRILMRIARFKASNFRQLERHLKEIPWELHISDTSDINVSAKAIHSRLYHTAAIADRIRHAIDERVGRVSPAHSAVVENRAVQNLWVRVLDDRFVISLDSSGEPLYKRGLKENVGKAPLRETLAAAALYWAGYRGKEPLMDPMCGSGTFSLEAALISNRTPPGWHRDFVFMNWPAFRAMQWEHLKKERSLEIAPVATPAIFASDKDSGACASLVSVIEQYDLARAVSVVERDFFDIDPDQISRKPGVVVLNPPYGVRLGSITQTHKRFAEIADKLSRDYRKWGLAVFLPDGRLTALFPAGLKQRRILHGGLNLTLLTGLIS